MIKSRGEGIGTIGAGAMGPDESTISMGYTVIFPYLYSNFFLVIFSRRGAV